MWKFIISASKKSNWYQHSNKEICFIGRSNVGKSSLLNALAKTKIAKTSNTPGRTQLINYFSDDLENIYVDLPGYGYARLSKVAQEKMFAMIEEYLKHSSNLSTVFLLFDANIGLTSDDQLMIAFLESIGRKTILVGTKIDKANQAILHKTKKQLEALKYQSILVSSAKKTNLEKLQSIILEQF
ncbi:ribosome biogenesis GTP-binding protein YihA/YsxC [Mycoplasma iguanae]|uniref:Probable GTP-binding protein EngB n=1 Tax=Mycoplasma iguanae TaxID=292461 RepID=A0ABY5R8H8_9MOLU|nr:ribosome biogenesis GTP-binding protein YihA/YsxC [Mycoplasma iguanae]UVD81749.1 ribosome biogenesis GTP-binding protein YihA/YsxC [Mycoplasma iguanae]